MKKSILLILLSIFLFSCASICTIPPIAENINNQTITFEESKMPCKKQEEFENAVRMTITAIFSNDFEQKLKEHMANNLGTGKHTDAWKNLTASKIVTDMRSQIDGTYADTYGGIKGWWLNLIYGNIAYDGTESGPIRLNRIPLRKRTSAQISNTIAHEVAHRIGLKHPHSDEDLDIANLEPPYIIGDMIEEIVNNQSK